MKKLAYVFDGNYVLHKTLSVCGVFDENDPMFLKYHNKERQDKDRNSLLHKLTMDFSSDIRKVNRIIDEIIITVDDYSWRNDFFNDKEYKYSKQDVEVSMEIESIDYKGNREKDKVVNWSLIYKTFDDFLIELKRIVNIKYVKIKGCEGDDLIFAICKYYNSIGKSCMIYSGDNDLKQLIYHNELNDAFTIYHKKTEKMLVMCINTAKYLKSNKNSIISNIFSFGSDNGIELCVENSFDLIFTKILLGDKGDNVKPTILETRITKSGKTKGEKKVVKIGKRVIDKVKSEILLEKSYSFDDLFKDSFLSLVTNSVIRNFKPESKFKPDDIKSNIEINRDLMFLHVDCLPKSIYDSMIEWLDQNHSNIDLKVYEFNSYTNLLDKMSNYTKIESSSSANLFKLLGL